MDFPFLCVICERNGSPVKLMNVSLKRKVSLIESSRKRSDGKEHFFENNLHLVWHDKCRKSYTSQKCINAHVRKEKEKVFTFSYLLQNNKKVSVRCFILAYALIQQVAVTEKPPTPKKRCSDQCPRKISLKNMCLFCAERITPQFLSTSEKYRRTISQVINLLFPALRRIITNVYDLQKYFPSTRWSLWILRTKFSVELRDVMIHGDGKYLGVY